MNAIFSLEIYYLVVFFFAVYAASFGIPTGAMLIIVSFASVAESGGELALISCLAFLATIFGDYSAYSLAAYFRGRFERITNKIDWICQKKTNIEKIFRRYGIYTVFLSRFFLSGVGPYINYFSALQGMTKRSFLVAIILGEFVYCCLFISLGYFFSETWQSILRIVKNYTFFVLSVFMGIYIIYKIVKLIIYKNKRTGKEIKYESS